MIRRSPIARLANMILRGVVSIVNDAPREQELQILVRKSTFDDVERPQDYGFTSVPLPGSESYSACLAGMSHQIVLRVGDRRYRLRGLQGGDVAIFDFEGQEVVLTRDGIRIATTKTLLIQSPTTRIESDVTIAGDVEIEDGDLLVGGDSTTTGDVNANGEVRDHAATDPRTLDALRDTYNIHTHTNDGANPPVQQA